MGGEWGTLLLYSLAAGSMLAIMVVALATRTVYMMHPDTMLTMTIHIST